MSLSIDLILLIVVTGILAYRLFTLIGKPVGHTVPPEIQKAVTDAYHKFVADNKLVFSQDAEEGLKNVLTAYPFNFPEFVMGAKKAFKMIMEAFSNGETAPLKNLLSPTLYKSFETEIKKRKKTKQSAEFELVRFKKIELISAKLSKTVAALTLTFDTEQVNVLKDAKGKVLSGSAEMIEDATDTWTFKKDMASGSTLWQVASVS